MYIYGEKKFGNDTWSFWIAKEYSMILDKLFGRNKQKQVTESAKTSQIKSDPSKIEFYYRDYDISNIEIYMNEIADILQIEIPEYHFVPYMADTSEGHMILEEYEPRYLNNYVLAYNYDNQPLIHFGIYNPMSQSLIGEGFMLYTIAHELRHEWQKKYHYDLYYGKQNAVGIETINDPSEIDADAFAMAYMRQKTSYAISEFFDDNTRCFFEFDGKQRYDRVKLIENGYFSKKWNSIDSSKLLYTATHYIIDEQMNSDMLICEVKKIKELCGETVSISTYHVETELV